MTTKAKILIAVGLFILLVGGLWVTIWAVSSSSAPEAPIPGGTTSERSLSGLTLEEDQKNVLAVSTELLNATAAPTSTAELTELLTKLDEGDASMMDPKVSAAIHWSGAYSEDSELQANVFQSLLTFASLAKQATDSDVIAPGSDDAWGDVFVDQTVGVAYVPVSVYLGSSSYFNLEFFYVDRAWKLSPYQLMGQVRLAAASSASLEVEQQ